MRLVTSITARHHLRPVAVGLGAALLFCALAAEAGAQVEVVFSKTYVRNPGPPVTVIDSFAVCDPAGEFTLVVDNGPGGARRVSSATVSLNGVEILHPSDFNQQVGHIERPLSNVAADNQMAVRLAGAPGGTILLSVRGVQSCGAMRITSPAAGSTVTGPQVLVRGTYPAAFGADVGVTVNGARGLAGNGEFAALVPVDRQVTSLTAVARDAAGVTLGEDTIAVSVEPGPAESAVALVASPAMGISPVAVELTLVSNVAVSQIAVDQDGDGVTDFQGTTLEGVRFTYDRPGLYLATATATTPAGPERASAIVQIDDRATLEALLQARWQALKDALRQGNVDAAVQLIATGSRDRYRAALEAIAADLPGIDSILTGLTFVRSWGPEVTFEMRRSDAGVEKSFEVRFGVDVDGVWRLRAF